MYPEQVDKPERSQRFCLDCSGFIRMVWGYRRHLLGNNYPDTIPLCLKPQKPHRAIPRRAFEICSAAPGIVIGPDTRSGQRLLAARSRRPRLLRGKQRGRESFSRPEFVLGKLLRRPEVCIWKAAPRFGSSDSNRPAVYETFNRALT